MNMKNLCDFRNPNILADIYIYMCLERLLRLFVFAHAHYTRKAHIKKTIKFKFSTYYQ